MPFLKRVTGEPAGQCIPLDRDMTVIGRSPEVELVLDPHGVSRRHAQIRREGENFYLTDLRSRNKTKVNNEDLAPMQDHLLKQGDRINICDVEFVFSPRAPEVPSRWRAPDEMVVTEGVDDSTIQTLDASSAGLLKGTVRPEAKLRAILEIPRNLSSNLKIDAVAPK